MAPQAEERFSDRPPWRRVEEDRIVSSTIVVLPDSADYRDGQRAHREGKERDITQDLQWLLGWDAANQEGRQT